MTRSVPCNWTGTEGPVRAQPPFLHLLHSAEATAVSFMPVSPRNVRATCCHCRDQTWGTESCTQLPPLCQLPRGHKLAPTAFCWCAGLKGLQPCPHFRQAQPAGTQECFPAPTQLLYS